MLTFNSFSTKDQFCCANSAGLASAAVFRVTAAASGFGTFPSIEMSFTFHLLPVLTRLKEFPLFGTDNN